MPQNPTYVSLDLETTGTNAQNDRIIEIGAVKFTPDGIAETFARLVNPGRRLPYRVHVLTGLTDEELAVQPRIEVLLSELEAFISGVPLVGQSIEFDIAFLKQAGLELAAPAYDTFELASLFLPEARDYGLRGLAEFFGLDFPVRHRALEDALAAKDVFLALRARIHALPPAVLDEILRLAQELDWPSRDLLSEVAAPQALFLHHEGVGGVALRSPDGEHAEMRPQATRRLVSPEESSRLLREAGARGLIAAYEERPQQFEMTEAVATALGHSRRLVIEAGTGTGKSLAYLVPAALHAMRNGERVVISTDTINLQEQLQGKDVPATRGALTPVDGIEGLRATTLKGRRNYLCLLAWSQALRQPAATIDELRMLIRLLVWMPQTETGDRSELNITQQEEPIWSRLSAQNEDCLSGPSIFVKQGTCFLLRARKRAESAHLLIVNHALLVADLAAGGGVIPAYQHLIVDEGHNLEEEATRGLGFASSLDEVEAYLDGITPEQGAGGGMLVFLRAALRGSQNGSSTVTEIAGQVGELAAQARSNARMFFGALRSLVEQHAGDGFEGERRLHLTSGSRAQPAWNAVEVAWDNLALVLSRLEERLIKLFSALLQAHSAGELDAEALAMQVDGAAAACRELASGIAAIVERHDAQRVCWASLTRRGDVAIASAPLAVGETLREGLFEQKLSTIVTSATLSTAGSFDYLKQRIGLEDADDLLLGSPFDFKSAVLMLLPTDMPEPQEAGYQKAVEESTLSLVRGSGGRSLALFTSHSALRATYQAIKGDLEALDIQVLAQGLDGTAKQLTTALRENDRTLLLGTASFWEGVDIAGDALSVLIIAKLPFPVPTDPIFAARSELFDDPFSEFALPQAILRFKQGFGRLIRHRDDRGVVAVLDRRLMTRAYGPQFLDSLPECTVRRIPLRSLEEAGREWLTRSAEAVAG